MCFYIIHNYIDISFHSIEGKRVEINKENKADCEVKITNVGPEDEGIWRFRALYVDNQFTYKTHSYEHTVYVDVQGIQKDQTEIFFIVILLS